MKKILFLIGLFLISINLFLASAYAKDVEIKLNDYECLEDGSVRVSYGLINNRNFDINNVILGFKIIVDEKPIACKEIKVNVPEGSNGSEIREIFIEGSCKPGIFKLGYGAFHLMKRYKIDEWFSGCPK